MAHPAFRKAHILSDVCSAATLDINELLKENLLELDAANKKITVPKNYKDRLILYLMKKAKEKKAKYNLVVKKV